MLDGCGRLHTCFGGFVNGVAFCGLMRLPFRLEARSARRDVLEIGTSDAILTVSSFRCTEGIQLQFISLGQLDTGIRVN